MLPCLLIFQTIKTRDTNIMAITVGPLSSQFPSKLLQTHQSFKQPQKLRKNPKYLVWLHNKHDGGTIKQFYLHKKLKIFHLATPLASSRPITSLVLVNSPGNALSKPNHAVGGQKSSNFPPGDSKTSKRPNDSTGRRL